MKLRTKLFDVAIPITLIFIAGIWVNPAHITTLETMTITQPGVSNPVPIGCRINITGGFYSSNSITVATESGTCREVAVFKDAAKYETPLEPLEAPQ